MNSPEQTQLYDPTQVGNLTQTALTVRLCKIMLVAALGLHVGLIAFNNIVDYSSNFNYVTHILQMDSIFVPEQHEWRSIQASFLHHAFYWLVISWQFLVAAFCFAGAYQCWRVRKQSVAQFNQAKWLAIIGVTLNMLLWLVVFNTIGGEWFLMWQSADWNVQNSTFRLFMISGVILLILINTERELR